MKLRHAIPLFIMVVITGRVSAQTSAFNGFCYQGGIQSQTSGLPSSNFLLGVIPNCTVTVYLTGTTTKATIYADALSTHLSNPFKAKIIGSTGAGQWLFYAPNGQTYDVVMSGGNSPLTYPSPVTLTGLGGGSGGGGSGPLIQTNGTNNVLQTLLNFQNTATVNFSNPSGGIEQAFCNTTSGVGSLGCFFIPLTGTGAPSASCSISNASQNYYDINPGVTSPTVYICKLVGSSYAWQAIATGSMVYPGAGVPLSTGSAWGTSYAVQGTDSKLLSSGIVSGIAGALLCLDGAGGASTGGCTVLVPVFQHNGTNLVNQSTINFNDTTPAPPAGFTNVTFQTNSGGAISAYVPTQNGFQMQQIPPQSGQYVIVYATASANSTIGVSDANSSNVWGILSTGPLGLGGNGEASIVWSGFTLPSYVNPANVTSVWASATSESGPNPPGSGTCLGGPIETSTDYSLSIAATGTGIGTFNLIPGGGGSVKGNALGTTTDELTGMTGANVPSITVNGTLQASGTCVGSNYANIPQVLLYVYYTGTAPPADNNVMVQPPLQFADNTLSISSQAHFPGTSLVPTTINALPDAETSTDWLVPITNGVSSTDCTTGGGSHYVICQSNGSSWSSYNVSGAVSSVSNSDSSLTFSPTTGAVVGSLNVAHSNTWTATQTMSGLVLSGITGSTQCLQVNSGGTVSGTGSACGSGSSGISGGVSGQVAIFGSATTITSGIALGTTGSDIPQLSGGLLNNSVVNWAAPGAIGSGTPNTGSFTTLAASSTVTFPGIEGAGTYCVQVSATGVLSNTGAACGSGSGAVNSVSNSDSTLVFSPTTGAVVGSLNLANANAWTALQTFGTHISIGGVTATGATGTGNVVFSASPTLTGTLIAANMNTSGTVTMTGIEAASSTSCLQISTSGSVTNTGTACGAGGSGLSGVNKQTSSYTAVSGDNNKAIPFDCSSTCSLTLPTSVPAAPWTVFAMDWGVTTISIIPTSGAHLYAVSGADLGTGTLNPGMGLSIWSDGINYFINQGGIVTGSNVVPEYVQSLYNNNPTPPTTITYTTDVSPGSALVFEGYHSSSSVTATITDNQGDTFNLYNYQQVSGEFDLRQWVACNAKGGPTTITTSLAFSVLFAYEFSNVASSSCVDGNNSAQGSNVASLGTGSVTTTDPFDLIFVSGAGRAINRTYTEANGYTDILTLPYFASALNYQAWYGIQPSTGSLSDTVTYFTSADPGGYYAGILALKPAANTNAIIEGDLIAAQPNGSLGALHAGVDGYVLTSNGPGTIPTYQAPSGSGTVVPSSRYDAPYYSATGSGSTLTGVAINGFQYDSTSGVPAAATASQAATLIQGLSGCSTSGFVFTPAGSDCINVSAISGGVSGEVALFGSATTITSGVQLGTTGSDIPQLSGGLLATSILPKATASAFGAVEGDGSTITLASGVISCTTATTSQVGCVKPDGTTIAITGGVISVISPGLGLPTKSYTSSQTASSADNNYEVVMNCNSCNYTLPATQPSTQWTIGLQFRGTGDALVLASGASYNSNTNSPQVYEDQLISITANQQTTTDYIGPNLLASSAPTYTAGASVTSCGQASGYTNTNDRGEVTIVGGSATTGTICTVNFSSTLNYAPGLCTVNQNGGTTLFSIGHGTASTTSFTITAGISVISSTVNVDYRCSP